MFVFGANGMMGDCFCSNSVHTIEALTRDDYDITTNRPEEIYRVLKERRVQSGDYVVNCAGAVKQRHYSKYQFILLNTLFPHQLQKLCHQIGVTLIQVSTDCVFDGAEGYYSEQSPPTCTDDYGMSKVLGEPPDACCIRTSIVGLGSKDNTSLLDWAINTAQQQLPGFTDHFWNGLTTLELTKRLDYLIGNEKVWQGVRHVHGQRISKYELLKEFVDVFSISKEVVPTSSSMPCDRSLVSNYDSSDKQFQPLSFRQQLIELNGVTTAS